MRGGQLSYVGAAPGLLALVASPGEAGGGGQGEDSGSSVFRQKFLIVRPVLGVVALRVLVVTPTHNETGHIRQVVASMAAQSRPPDLWVIVDDNSTDGTAELLPALSQGLAFIRVISAPPGDHEGASDRLAKAAAPRTFNLGLRHAGHKDFDFVAKIDGDIELPPHYLECLLARFDEDPRLGIASGELVEPRGGRWRRVKIPSHHVPGAVKLYTSQCFRAIGGVREHLGWDTVDEMTARMQGFATRSYDDLVARHHRPTGGADGMARRHRRHGACAWIAGYPLYFVLARSLKLAVARPVLLSSLLFLYGYLTARLTYARVEDHDLRAHVRRELRARALGRWSLRAERPS